MKMGAFILIFLALITGFFLGFYVRQKWSSGETEVNSISPVNEKPSFEEVQEAIQKKQMEFYQFKLKEFEVSLLPNERYQINFKGTLNAQSDLYALANLESAYDNYRVSPTTPFKTIDGRPLRFLRKVASANQSQEVYGRCYAEKYMDRWSIEFEGFVDRNKFQGVPLSLLGKSDFIIENSSEAEATFQRLATESQTKEKAKKIHLDSILPYLTPEKVFEGKIFIQDESRSPQRIQITFKEVIRDGSLITAIITNPEDEKDWVSFRGSINFDFINSPTPESDPERQLVTAHPLKMLNEPKSYRDRKESLKFYHQYGYWLWVGFKNKELVGKIGREFNTIEYSFNVVLKP